MLQVFREDPMLALTAYAVIATLALLFACAVLANNASRFAGYRSMIAEMERVNAKAQDRGDKLNELLNAEITHSEKLRIDLINAQKNDHRDARGRFAKG